MEISLKNYSVLFPSELLSGNLTPLAVLFWLMVSYNSSYGQLTQINYHGKAIVLKEQALYVNAKLKGKSSGKYVFTSLQDAVAYAKDGTAERPTTIYLEPDVYWTDDPAAENLHNNLIGLKMPQAFLTLIGLSDNAEHTIIAGNRGQMAGAIGNWNTIGLGDGFQAYNITFGNYCNVDLIYTLNSAKNYPRRQENITQAQVITKANGDKMDKWLFKNCRFISFLNVFAGGNEPHRAFYDHCFFQCTDDAIGTGDMNVFQQCSFKLFSNHPSGSASKIIQVYLGCIFNTVLKDSRVNPTVFFAKQNDTFAVIDCTFSGNAQRLEWTDHPLSDVRHYVHHNVLNGKPVAISASRPELSVGLHGDALRAYKLDTTYNIYNLLRGNDGWDPAAQKEQMGAYANLPYKLLLKADKIQISPEFREQAIISYQLYPERLRKAFPVKWSVSDQSILSILVNKDSTITVTGSNETDHTLKAYIQAETATGILAVLYIEVLPKVLPAPVFVRKPSVSGPTDGIVNVNYVFVTDKNQDAAGKRHGDADKRLHIAVQQDQSGINWYRSERADGHDSILVAVSRMNNPLKNYRLSSGDIGYYLIAKVTPKYPSSAIGNAQMSISRKIGAKDIASKTIETDFKNLPTQKSDSLRNGFWIIDAHRPADLSDKFPWEPANSEIWTYGMGSGGTFGKYGLMTTGRGARILYSQSGKYENMSLSLDLSPHKESGQGFGSATGQYVDVYIKFDPATLTGYGLRIERTSDLAKEVKLSLMKFNNGIGIAIADPVNSSLFLPGCKLKLIVKGSVLTALLSNTNVNHGGDKGDTSLSCPIERNPYGGFGVQHTGTVSSGNRLMLESMTVEY